MNLLHVGSILQGQFLYHVDIKKISTATDVLTRTWQGGGLLYDICSTDKALLLRPTLYNKVQMAPPTFYDPQSLDEQPVPLPNACLIKICPDIVLQPPLSRRGTGPGIIIFLPDSAHLVLADQSTAKPLDPDPITKWAEEGFAVVAIAGNSSDEVPSVANALKKALEALQALEQVDIKQKFAVIGGYHRQMYH